MIEKFRDMIRFATPLRIVKRNETLMIEDYRPTLPMLLSVCGLMPSFTAIIFIYVDIGFQPDSFGIWMAGIATLVCIAITLYNPLRETYYFDAEKDTYAWCANMYISAM